MVVLDTMILSDAISPAPSPQVLEWLDSFPRTSLYTTAVTAAELRCGAAHLPRGRRRNELAAQIEAILTEDFIDRILPFDNAASVFYAEITSMRRKTGKSVEEFDQQIASIARVHGFAVATRNLRHFEDCGIELINPWDHER